MAPIPEVRFYATAAPPWWPYQLVGVDDTTLPPPRQGFYRFLVDNGMFRFVQLGERPGLDKWLARILRFVAMLERTRRPEEVWVILPDWPDEPELTVKAASHPLAKTLCRDRVCVAVAHRGTGLLNVFRNVAGELASLDTVGALAAPLKIYCSKYRVRAQRHIVNRECQVTIASQVCRVARDHGVPCHGLGALLSPQHVARLAEAGVTSIDTTSWTRPNTADLRRRFTWSAKTTDERELFFAWVLARLYYEGKLLVKDIPLHPSCERACYEDMFCEDRGDCVECLADCILSTVAWEERRRETQGG